MDGGVGCREVDIRRIEDIRQIDRVYPMRIRRIIRVHLCLSMLTSGSGLPCSWRTTSRCSQGSRLPEPCRWGAGAEAHEQEQMHSRLVVFWSLIELKKGKIWKQTGQGAESRRRKWVRAEKEVASTEIEN